MYVRRNSKPSLIRTGIPLIQPYYGAAEEQIAEIQAAASDAIEDATAAMERAEDVATEAVQTVTDNRMHRRAIYMVGAPIIIYVGLTSEKHPKLGKLAALFGMFIGLRNYRAESVDIGADAAELDLPDLSGYGRPPAYKGYRYHPNRYQRCSPPKWRDGKPRCPRGSRLRVRRGRKVCCR